MSNKYPDFIVVGAAKTGTTSIHEYLNEHPSVFMSTPKETNYFFNRANGQREYLHEGARDPATHIATEERYLALFDRANSNQVTGESSPSYMFTQGVPELIQQARADTRIVMMLRNPAERAWSDFLHNQRDGTEPFDTDEFMKAFEAIPQRMAEGWHPHYDYELKGCYGTLLDRWENSFPSDQLGLFFYDDFKADAGAFMRSLYGFLGVDPDFQPKLSARYNVTGSPKNRWMQHLIGQPNMLKKSFRWMFPAPVRRRIRFRLMQQNLNKAPALSVSLRNELAAHYLPEIEKLETICKRDLSAWKPESTIQSQS